MIIDKALVRAGFTESGSEKDTAPGMNLEAWMVSPTFQIYVGRSVAMKLEILQAVFNGDANIAAIARRYSVTRQAGHAMANRARQTLLTMGQLT
jgi:hypothetical protein